MDGEYNGGFVFDKQNLVDYIINKYAKDFGNRLISPIKLQKGLYFLFAFWGGKIRGGRGREDVELPVDDFHDCLFNANFCAWKYGPVDREIYNQFKHYRNIDDVKLPQEVDLQHLPDISDREYYFAKDFVESYLNRIFITSDFGLVDLSHKDECWKKAFYSDDTPIDNEINSEDIINEYVGANN